MRKLISFMHISLDGFVAGPNGEMDWIKINNEIFGYVGKRISLGDTAMYGRVTYQMMEGYWPTAGSKPNASRHDIEHAEWYGKIRKIVLSRSLEGKSLHNTTIISDHISTQINAIKQQEGSEILVFGSPSATHELMQRGLIDGYWLFVNPVILGKGIPLFTNIQEKVELDLLHTHQFDCGVTELSYHVSKRKQQ